MTALSGIEGELTVGILVVDATVADVRLRSTRATGIGAMLPGRPMGEALSLVPMLFSLCGIAQGIAAANACEAAIGDHRLSPPSGRRARFADPGRDGGQPWLADRHGMAPPRRRLPRPRPAFCRSARRHPRSLPPSIHPATGHVRAAALLSPDAEKLSDARSAPLGGDRPADRRRLFQAPERGRPSSLVAATRQPRIPADRPHHRRRYGGLRPQRCRDAARSAAGLVRAAPDIGTGLLQSAALRRQARRNRSAHRIASTPLIADLKRRHGNGLLTRFTAKLVELASLPARLAALSGYLSPEHPGETPPEPTGSGAGLADTARGRLAHWIALDQGIVQGFPDRRAERMELPSPGRARRAASSACPPATISGAGWIC